MGDKSMKIISWNISFQNKIQPKIEYLLQKLGEDPFIVILQEVTQQSYEALCAAFLEKATVEFSLQHRIPGKYDTRSRKLGIAIICSSEITVLGAQVLDRSLFPDRTLVVDIVYNGKPFRVMGLHSITGCEHGKAKEIQYFSFSEAVDEYRPDIVGIDANEPEIDHYDISKMKFFDNYSKGKGCQTFFSTMSEQLLEDAFVKHYDIQSYIEGKYLATSHIIHRGRKTARPVRYDFLFLNREKFKEYNCYYDYEAAVAAGSDHAAVILSAD